MVTNKHTEELFETKQRNEEVTEHPHLHEDGSVHSHPHTHEDGSVHSHPHTHEDGSIHSHTHTHEDGTTHTHTHVHPHAHYHDPKEKKRQINRLAKVIGHLQHVKKMIENDEDCAEVLIQLSASKSALNGLAKEIISEHISHCIVHAMEDGDTQSIEEFKKSIEKFL